MIKIRQYRLIFPTFAPLQVKTMPRKKKISEKLNITAPDHKQNQLKRYRERLERESKRQEQKRNELFTENVNSATQRKAPVTLRTKAYYRYAKDYPSEVTHDGFRENVAVRRKMTRKGKIALAVSCILVFLCTFMLVQTGIELSKRAPAGGEDIPVSSSDEAMTAVHFTPSEFSSKSAEELKNELEAKNANSCVIEFKDDYGYVYFDVNSFIGGSADKKVSDAWDKVDYLQENSIRCIAYISCFTDTVAASSLSGMEVKTSSGLMFTDSALSGWLDPFSPASGEYLISLIEKAADGGFDNVLIDNVCFPTEFSVSAPVFSADANTADRNSVLCSFITDAANAAGTDKLITMCDISGFAVLSDTVNEKYGGTVLDTKCISYALDTRRDTQYEQQLADCTLFNHIEEMPLSFLLDAGVLALKSVTEQKEASILIAVIDRDLEKGDEYIKYAGFGNIIYW